MAKRNTDGKQRSEHNQLTDEFSAGRGGYIATYRCAKGNVKVYIKLRGDSVAAALSTETTYVKLQKCQRTSCTALISAVRKDVTSTACKTDSP